MGAWLLSVSLDNVTKNLTIAKKSYRLPFASAPVFDISILSTIASFIIRFEIR